MTYVWHTKLGHLKFHIEKHHPDLMMMMISEHNSIIREWCEHERKHGTREVVNHRHIHNAHKTGIKPNLGAWN